MNILRFIVVTISLTLFSGQVFSQDISSDQYTLSDTISIETANASLESCLKDFPKKFTPKAHEHFCNCSAANLRLNMTNSDLVDLNKSTARVAGNPIFEKYIQKVTVPCMSVAIDTIAYVGCLEHKGHSPYIKNILPYCQCVGSEMAKYTTQKGASTIIINMTRNPKFYNDPVQTLLMANEYNMSVNQAYRTCRPYGLEKTRYR